VFSFKKDLPSDLSRKLWESKFDELLPQANEEADILIKQTEEGQKLLKNRSKKLNTLRSKN
jgi:hypothetical protein